MHNKTIETRLERLEQAIIPPQSIFVVRINGEEKEVLADSFFADTDRMDFVRMGYCSNLGDLDKLLDFAWKEAWNETEHAKQAEKAGRKD